MISLEHFYLCYLIAAPLLLAANGIWVYRDARARGRSGLLVGFLVLGTFPLGVVLWLLTRPRLPEESVARVVAEPETAECAVDPDRALKERANAGLL
jgi:hypothetical protein